MIRSLRVLEGNPDIPLSVLSPERICNPSGKFWGSLPSEKFPTNPAKFLAGIKNSTRRGSSVTKLKFLGMWEEFIKDKIGLVNYCVGFEKDGGNWGYV